MRKQGGPEVFRITGARTGLTEDVRGRQRRYIISMSIRTLSVILTVVLWNVERPLAWVTLVLGALLPYVAVVYANAGRENAPSLPTSSYIPPPSRPALEPTKVEHSAEREAAHSADHEAAHEVPDGTAHEAPREAAPTAGQPGAQAAEQPLEHEAPYPEAG